MNDKFKEYASDDEEPKCNRCDNINNDDDLCEKYCGEKHCWNGYVRTGEIEEE